MRFLPIVALALCASGWTAGMAPPALAQAPSDDSARAEREGPFVMTDKTLGALLEDGFEIKGMLGGAMILVSGVELYSCGLTPDRETLSYQPYFACSILDEIPPAGHPTQPNRVPN